MPTVSVPLAQKLRPKHLNEIVGQTHLIGKDRPLTKIIERNSLPSMIFWGPAGTGKTTMAQILAEQFANSLHFEQISAIFSGVADLKRIFAKAEERRAQGQATLLFIDEVHRFNKSQQDCLLPVLEDGTIILIGATTETPSFALNGALLSRVQVFAFKALTDSELAQLLDRAEQVENRALPLDEEARQALIRLADGDGRALLGMVESLWCQPQKEGRLGLEDLVQQLQHPVPKYARTGDDHYNLISALHKAIRGSDPDAALYYLARMLQAGEDPLYLCRRLIRVASEDIGLADPEALKVVCAAQKAFQILGSPEGELAIAQACLYLACAPKSNAVYLAYKNALQAAKSHGSQKPPLHILNAPTKELKKAGYGKEYIYDHDEPHAFSGQNYFPESMEREKYYFPVDRGFEREIRKRLNWWEKLRKTKYS